MLLSPLVSSRALLILNPSESKSINLPSLCEPSLDPSANWVLIDIKRNGYTSGGAPSEGNFENFKTLCPNLNNAENASGGTTNDVVSNGFKIRGGTDRNISGQKHIYIAFAERPDSTAYDTEPNAR